MVRASIAVAAACLVLSAGATVTRVARAQTPERPEVAQERRAMAFYRSLKSGDADSAVRVLEANLTPATWQRRSADDWRRMAGRLVQDLGSMELEGVDVLRPNTLNLTLAPANAPAPAATLGFEFEAGPPFRISGLSVERGGPGEARGSEFPAFSLPAGADRPAIIRALTRYFDDLATRDLFSGTALVAYKGEVLFTAAHGLATKRYDVPNRLSTRFDLGSINKAFTKIAIGQLLARGKLSLDDRLIRHVPDYPNRTVAEQITIRQLLEHASGLGDLFNETFRRSSRALYRSPRDYFPIFADEPLLFEPGSARQYSNAGYIVLGAVIEELSGEPYDAYVRRHIFEPAGMTRSGFFERDAVVPDIAEGYTRMMSRGEDGERRSNMFMLPIKGNAAGSAQSTVEDLWRFDRALRTHRLLPPAYTAWFFQGPEPAPGRPAAAGEAPPATEGLGIAGGGPGVSAVLESNGDLVIAALSNYDPPGAEAIAQRLWRELKQRLP